MKHGPQNPPVKLVREVYFERKYAGHTCAMCTPG